MKAEHEYLLLVSRTRTDEQGRRHSIAVPVIPPPDGVKFEGGYHIERNPINGAARLVPPDGKIMWFYVLILLFLTDYESLNMFYDET